MQHGDGQGSQLTGVGLDPQPREELQHGSGVPDPVEEPGSLSEQGVQLLEVDAQAAEEDSGLTHVGLIGQGRSVNGQEDDVMPKLRQLGGKGIVSQATAAVHAGRACGDREDLHEFNWSDAGELPSSTRCASVFTEDEAIVAGA